MTATSSPPRASLVLSREVLAAALAATVPVLRRNATLPVLHTVRWDGLSLTATDLDVTVTVPLPGDPQAGWPGLCLHGATFANLVRALPKGEVSVGWSATEATVAARGDRFKLVGLSIEEFPQIPVVDGPSFAIPADQFHAMLTAVNHALARGEAEQSARPLFTGMHWRERDGKLVVEGTDSHRMVQYASDVAAPIGLASCLPGLSITSLLGLLATSGDAEVTVTAEPTRIAVENPGAWRLTTRLLDFGKFPDVERIIPRDSNRMVCRFDPAAWSSALSRVAVLAEEARNRVLVEIGEGQVTMRTEHQDRGTGHAGAACEIVSGTGPVTTPLNVRQFREMLTHLPADSDDHLTLKFGKKEKGALVFEGAPGVLGLLMPLIE